MKKILLGAMALLSLNGLAQNVNIPDPNFKAILVGNSFINTNGDTEIQVNEAQALSGVLNLNNQSIGDLTGIEAFTSLSGLQCNNNSLTSLDLSQNTALTFVWCTGNSLSSIDLGQNTALISLNCNSNSLTSLDVSQNTALAELYCEFNNLSSLNLANGNNSNMSDMLAQNNSSLACIQHDTGFDPTTNSNWEKDATASWSDNCGYVCPNIVNIPDANFKNALLAHGTTITGTGIAVIDTDGDGEICEDEAQNYSGYTIDVNNQNISDLTGIEAFTSITRLYCSSNSLSSIDISSNTDLIFFHCSSNNLTSIDVSNNSNLTFFQCTSMSSLTNLDVSNNANLQMLQCQFGGLTSLDISNNSNLYSLKCQGNDLTSLNVANGNNGPGSSELNYVDANNNPNLTCIQHDSGFDPTTLANWLKDATASWSDNCGPILVSSISVQGQGGATSITAAGGTLQMEAAVLPSDADDMTYTWSVTNGTGSATIDANGLLTAAADGTVDVIATANDGSGVTGSATITISNQSASINENSIAFSIVPNPTSGMVKIDSDIAIKSVEIYATSGQKVASFDSKEFDLSELEKGVYFLTVFSSRGIATTRIIKQ